jgi:hypothetical protein
MPIFSNSARRFSDDGREMPERAVMLEIHCSIVAYQSN